MLDLIFTKLGQKHAWWMATKLMGLKIHPGSPGNSGVKNAKQYSMTTKQWRNSYGLRVDKPAGIRVEGAPAWYPFTLMFQLTLPFQKSAPFQRFFFFFFIFWLWNSHNNAFHKFTKSEFGYLGAPPTRLGGRLVPPK